VIDLLKAAEVLIDVGLDNGGAPNERRIVAAEMDLLV